MTLEFEPDVSHADWWATRDEPWHQLCTIGPTGFAAYAQVLHPFLPGHDPHDPASLLQIEGELEGDVLAALVDVLTGFTTTPDDCFHALWEGFGDLHGHPAVTLASFGDGDPPSDHRVPPAFPDDVMAGPRVRIPHRDYLLFRGALADAGDWGAAELAPGQPRHLNSPTLLWPADRAWFLADEIDQTWAGVGGSHELVDALVADERLDVRPVACASFLTDPREEDA